MIVKYHALYYLSTDNWSKFVVGRGKEWGKCALSITAKGSVSCKFTLNTVRIVLQRLQVLTSAGNWFLETERQC
jgi:hypothetical protein